ncbi:MAG: ATP-binding protein [Planctomycetota bacterium]
MGASAGILVVRHWPLEALMSSEQPLRAHDLDPQTLARLAGGLAHELKNPLSTISLHLALLEEDWEPEDGIKARRTVKTVRILKSEVLRLNGILEDFLRFARTDSLNASLASLNAQIEQVVQFSTPEAQRLGIQIKSYLDLSLPLVMLDVGRMRQALLNLVINARQAMEERGYGTITFITRREGERAIVEIVDDGPGMEAETLKQCLQVYYSTKKGGSGLGMATVRRIVGAHGGTLSIESSPGNGTRVSMALPLEASPNYG